jgi:hypothetical protein
MEVAARCILRVLVAAALATAAGQPITAHAQTNQGDETAAPQTGEQVPTYRPPSRGAPGGRVGGASRGTFKPPPRGAPGGRVGGASRGTFGPPAPLPTIELLAPNDHTGLTTNPAPALYYFVSGPVTWPTLFTISAPGQPAPVLEVPIPAPASAGIYRLDPAAYGVRLEPGILYTWSVSAILDPRIRAHDIVASATLQLRRWDAAAAAAAGAPSPLQRAVLDARDGFWYDAVAAAVAAAPAYGRAALDALMGDVGLTEPVAYDRQAATFRAR